MIKNAKEINIANTSNLHFDMFNPSIGPSGALSYNYDSHVIERTKIQYHGQNQTILIGDSGTDARHYNPFSVSGILAKRFDEYEPNYLIARQNTVFLFPTPIIMAFQKSWNINSGTAYYYLNKVRGFRCNYQQSGTSNNNAVLYFTFIFWYIDASTWLAENGRLYVNPASGGPSSAASWVLDFCPSAYSNALSHSELMNIAENIMQDTTYPIEYREMVYNEFDAMTYGASRQDLTHMMRIGVPADATYPLYTAFSELTSDKFRQKTLEFDIRSNVEPTYPKISQSTPLDGDGELYGYSIDCYIPFVSADEYNAAKAATSRWRDTWIDK